MKKPNGSGRRMDILGIILDTVQNPSFAFYEGTKYLRTQDYDKAEQYLRRAVELKPEYGEAHYNLAECLRLQKDYEGAVDHFLKAGELEPYLKEKLMNRLNLEKEEGGDKNVTRRKDLGNLTFENYSS